MQLLLQEEKKTSVLALFKDYLSDEVIDKASHNFFRLKVNTNDTITWQLCNGIEECGEFLSCFYQFPDIILVLPFLPAVLHFPHF